MAQPPFPSLASIERPISDRALCVCIATEDVAGPTRNGGVGSTYAALATLLAEDGHDVTVLHLRPEGPERGDFAAWNRHFGAGGVRFAAATGRARRDGFRRPAERWLEGGYELLGWLLDHPMDVVHASEWGALPYVCLLAKHHGLAFHDTTFVIKASSPLRWSLESTGEAVSVEQADRVAAERRSIELADVVVGGSVHLLDWMRAAGYRLPQRTFVQPNVVTPLADGGSARQIPSPHGVDELVFFGRLEARKGLDLFRRAVDHLIDFGGPLPVGVTFLGKPGRSTHGGTLCLDALLASTAHWPFPVSIRTEETSASALRLLSGGARLAVCPSLAENASIALHELMLAGLPFVATDVGGNAELLRAENRAAVLCPPAAEALAKKLAHALAHGARAPRLAFDNAANLEVWKRFHRQLPARGVIGPGEAAPATAPTILRTLQRVPGELLATAMADPGPVAPRRPRPRGAPRRSVVQTASPPPSQAPRRRCGPTALAAAGLEGWCDPSADGVVHGWAWRFDAPEQPVTVAVYLDGALHACVSADLYREDLARAGVGDGGYGFDVPLPPTGERPRRVDVIATCAQLPLQRSPLVAIGRRLRPL